MKHFSLRRGLHVGALLLVLLGSPGIALGQAKVALVVGNGDYQSLGRLNNPPNDAHDIAATLGAIGFEVELLIDADLDQMEAAIIRMGQRLARAPGSTGLFYFAGHGVESAGENYLIPARATIVSESFLRSRAVPSQAVLEEMQRAGGALSLIILDACRDNPFSWARSASRGLAAVSRQPPGSIIAYATSAGSVAADGTGRNGTFTAELLKHIATPGIDVTEVLRRTGQGVRVATNGRQVPAIYSQFFESVYLAAPPTGPAPTPVETTALPPAPPLRTPARETLPTALVAGGSFQMGSPTGGRPDEQPIRTVTVSTFHMTRTEVTVGQFRTFVAATGYRTTAETSGGGLVWTGSVWAQRADASWRNPYLTQTDDHPVVLVSWFDAVAYANWLSLNDGFQPAYTVQGNEVIWDRSADGWRLPTEAEWEYAARGGAESRGFAFPGSNNLDAVAWHWDNARRTTHPVGSKQPNELGLFDMSGNVWEWCWDWYAPYSTHAQVDPVGPATGTDRVQRSGSFNFGSGAPRPTIRSYGNPQSQYFSSGFRLARSGANNP